MGATSYIHHPAAGASLWAADGKQFGYVKEVRGNYLKAGIPWAPDFWLACAHIEKLDGPRAVLRLRQEELEAHRLEQPGLDAATEQAPAVFTAGEVANQRERMERKLELQKERMRASLQ
jgi:hypothetical protein